MRNYTETLNWLQKNRTTRTIGFNPDNMCLKVTRTARGIPYKHQTAKQAQDATPAADRVSDISKLRAGMVLYFDDPKDSNRAGHIVTMIGRVPGVDKSKLASVLCITNSVKRGQLVTVTGDYFPKYWGDPFVFGAKSLNGVKLDYFKPATRVELFHRSGPTYNMKYLKQSAKKGRKISVKTLARIDKLIGELSPNPKFWRLRKVRVQYRDNNVLNMPLLNEAVQKGFKGKTRRIRDELQQLIKALPER